MTTFGDYDAASKESGMQNSPLMPAYSHGINCKCDPCKSRRKEKRAGNVLGICKLVIGLGIFVALITLAVFGAQIAGDVDAIAVANAPGSPAPCPNLACDCPVIPACPEIPACPSFPPCGHDGDGHHNSCPDVHCQTCGDCVGGSVKV